ncbi:hypothetical protein MUP01_04385 [Candidatus Bathyarchaeota archaeon]|nr:hypothetical protein [Candidatus Bathyarchaeota archaeon]
MASRIFTFQSSLISAQQFSNGGLVALAVMWLRNFWVTLKLSYERRLKANRTRI